jgi:alkylation response protein AidB-like acyl-CoA dehydrogenase
MSGTDDLETSISALAARVGEGSLRDWWEALFDAGLAFSSWPLGLGGRGLERSSERAIRVGLSKHGLIGPPPGLGTLMGGPVVAAYGTSEQQQRLLPPLAKGLEGWCQLFSEPGAGSDLASITTTAELDGEEWIVRGQKVWTSGAVESRRGMLVARTNWDVPKHRGLTYFIVDMDQPGVEVRPLRQMNNKTHFNEVFFNDARVHDRDRIGDVHGGWAITVATLGFERSGLSSHVAGLIQPSAGELAGNLDRSTGEIVNAAMATMQDTEQDSSDEAAPGSFHSLHGLARTLGRAQEAMISQGLVRLYTHERLSQMTQKRVVDATRSGRSPGPESSTAKLFWTEGLKISRDLAMEILGPWSGVIGPETPNGGRTHNFVLTVPSASIAGGSDEVQRNIIAERVLGLPKDVMVDADVAFRDVRRS